MKSIPRRPALRPASHPRQHLWPVGLHQGRNITYLAAIAEPYEDVRLFAAPRFQRVERVATLLHGEENLVSGDAGYTGVEKRAEHAGRSVIWQIAARRSTYKQLSKRSPLYKAKRKIEKAKAQMRAKFEHPFRVIKRQFGYTKVRFRGLAKNTAQLVTLFALSNLWMARRHLLTNTGEVRLTRRIAATGCV